MLIFDVKSTGNSVPSGLKYGFMGCVCVWREMCAWSPVARVSGCPAEATARTEGGGKDPK